MAANLLIELIIMSSSAYDKMAEKRIPADHANTH